MSNDVAGRLLDAQVTWLMGELSGDRLLDVLAHDVDDLLSLAEGVTVAELLDRDQVKAVLHRLVDRLGSASVVEDMVTAVSDALFDLGANEKHRLGQVVARGPVEALIEKLLSMQQLHDRAMERMADSPLVATVASRFVGRIVSDFVAQNRQLAEKLPGAKSLFSLGTSAANRVRNVGIIGDAAERGTQLAMRRTNGAMREVLKEAPLKGAALEIWDLHADEPISELRRYLTRDDLRALALLVHEIVSSARNTEYLAALLDESVEVFFQRYGSGSAAALLTGLGMSRDDLLAELRSLVPPLIEAAKADGRLETMLRARLAPFFASEQVLAIVAGADRPADPGGKPAPGPGASPTLDGTGSGLWTTP